MEDDIQDRRRAALTSWVNQQGGHAAVVREHRLTPSQASYLSQVIHGYSFAERAARNMEKRLGMAKGILDLSSPPKGAPPSEGAQTKGDLAQQMSQLQPIIEPRTISWESILAEPLPAFFRAVIPDDAMGAEFPRGCIVNFSTTEGPPRARDLVLVRDADGGVYFREYQTGRGGRWQAVALLSGYQALDSEADGLQVLAISMGRWGRRG